MTIKLNKLINRPVKVELLEDVGSRIVRRQDRVEEGPRRRQIKGDLVGRDATRQRDEGADRAKSARPKVDLLLELFNDGDRDRASRLEDVGEHGDQLLFEGSTHLRGYGRLE
jgi:hypothetical protein